MTSNLKILKQGAEAKLYVCTYLGKPTLIKERFAKKYRHTDLDLTITKERIRNEARAIVRCKTANVRTPSLYLVDFERRQIYMEHFTDSITLKDFIIQIIKSPESEKFPVLEALAKIVGKTIRKLHDSDIIHGDLTTSNMLLVNKTENLNVEDKYLNLDQVEFVIIDFGLSYIEARAEDKGVDLYVLERALLSTHNDFPELFLIILNAYKDFSKLNVKEIMSKFEEVRARGRKRTMVG